MTDAPAQTPGFTCLTCGYDLRTLPIDRSRIRCPECGNRNDLCLLRRQSVVGQQRRNSSDLDMTVFVGLLMMTGFIAVLGGASGMGDRVGLLFASPLAIGLTIAMCILAVAILRIVETGLLLWERVTLVGVSFALLLILNAPWSLLMVVPWWWTFRWRSLQGYE